MIRMEIALFLVLAFIAYTYFSAGRKRSELHQTFSILLVTMLFHLLFDAITIYTVNHLDTVPLILNNLVHRLFIGTMNLIMYLFYQYMAILVEQETGKPRKYDKIAKIYVVIAILSSIVLPIHYTQTEIGNFSSGWFANMCYVSVATYLTLCVGMLLNNWKKIGDEKKWIIGIAEGIEVTTCVIQGLHPNWLLSGMGLTLMTLSFYLTLENPEILRAELVEQKMSMLYLKSQVNPHFLYNTLDTIRIQAQLNGDEKVAELLMNLVNFFRMSIKVDRPMVQVEDELELLEAYMELMCYRYPELNCEYNVDHSLQEQPVPNFILQPIVENSLLHGLKNRGYKGTVRISVQKSSETTYDISVYDNGSGFEPGKKEKLEQKLLHYDRLEQKLEGNSIGVLNVQRRVKLLCGPEYGLWYTENEEGGVTAHIRLPLEVKE